MHLRQGGKKAKRDWWRCGQIFNKMCRRQLQYFWTCQPYTVSLCQPSVLYWGDTDCCSFLCWFFLWLVFYSVAQRFFQRSSSFTHGNWIPNTAYFTSIMQLHYVNVYFHSPIRCTQWQAFKAMSKGWILMFKCWKSINYRYCLLSSLPNHYPLGCIFLLTVEQSRE